MELITRIELCLLCTAIFVHFGLSQMKTSPRAVLCFAVLPVAADRDFRMDLVVPAGELEEATMSLRWKRTGRWETPLVWKCICMYGVAF